MAIELGERISTSVGFLAELFLMKIPLFTVIVALLTIILGIVNIFLPIVDFFGLSWHNLINIRRMLE